MCLGDLHTDGLIKNYIEGIIFKFDIVFQYILCFPHSPYVPYMFTVMKTIKTLTLCYRYTFLSDMVCLSVSVPNSLFLSVSLRCISRHIKFSWLSGKESAYQCRRCRRCGFDLSVGKIAWRRAWQPLQYSCQISMDREAWWPIVHGVTKSQIWLNGWAHMHMLRLDNLTMEF